MSLIVKNKVDKSIIDTTYWDVWESGELDVFEYSYDQDVCFVVQSGEATIHSKNCDPMNVKSGDVVEISKGFEGFWEIKSPIINK